MSRIAVVGAGLAGLACARALHDAGAEVTMFDKARRPGGRLATRRADGLIFDHGAQYATARGAAFEAFIAGAPDLIVPWDPKAAHPRWVGIPGMSAFARAAERDGIGTLRTGCRITAVTRTGDGWHLHHEGGAAGPFERIVLALPAPQAAPLLEALGHAFAGPVGEVAMQPCWCLMLAFAERQPGPDTRTLEDSPLAWIARDSSRPGRAALPDTWIAHASPAWSTEHLEESSGEAAAGLRAAFTLATGIAAEPLHIDVHRWRYARAETPLGQTYLWDPAGLAVCGDWCLGAKVEAAFESGHACAGVCV